MILEFVFKMNPKTSTKYKLALAYLGFLVLLGLFGPLLIPFSLIPWEANFMDLSSVGTVAPGINNHILGADTLGRDVLSGLIHGTRFSLQVATYSTGIAFILSLLIAFGSTYIGDNKLKTNYLQILFISFISFFAWFFLYRSFPNHSAFLGLIKALILLFINAYSYYISRSWFNYSWLKSIKIPMDGIGMKFTEFFYSIPSLLFILFLVGLTPKNGIMEISLIIGCLMWPVFFRYLRLEILREKSTDHFVALQNLGYSDSRIISIHFLPNIIQPITTPLIFVFISAILIEATLSFLGIGINPDIVTWGKLLAQARLRIDAWWLAIFPGLMIFITVLALNVLSKEKIE